MTSWIEGLPELDGQRVGVFCTFAFFPHTFADVTARTSGVLGKLGGRFALKGGEVVSSHPFHQGDMEREAATFVSKVLASSGG